MKNESLVTRITAQVLYIVFTVLLIPTTKCRQVKSQLY